ncbi:hypothetical protein [Collimonas humicola]|uniref:hypothetical protein n=1 Tax=Collimonas humicola TaxID=2825886 RepID=UPI001B8CAA70|nr:hypothetical protein [Collimonas humicola]
MMYSNPAFRNKVYFTEGIVVADGSNVDNFLAWNGASVRWNDPRWKSDRLCSRAISLSGFGGSQ